MGIFVNKLLGIQARTPAQICSTIIFITGREFVKMQLCALTWLPPRRRSSQRSFWRTLEPGWEKCDRYILPALLARVRAGPWEGLKFQGGKL